MEKLFFAPGHGGEGWGELVPPLPLPSFLYDPVLRLYGYSLKGQKTFVFQMPRQEIFSSPASAVTGALFFLALTMHLKFVSD